MATIFEGFIIAITILSTNIADGNKIWGFIMVTQHIPTMTKSHHDGEMSVMINVGICQWQNPTIHEKYYWEYICLKVPHITTGNQENILLFFWGGPNFLGRENLFWDSLSISVPTIQNQCAFSWKQELQVKSFEPRDYSKRTANQVSMRETDRGQRKIKRMQPMCLCIISRRQFRETFENTQWRKDKQMQPVWLCMLWAECIEESFENPQWGK